MTHKLTAIVSLVRKSFAYERLPPAPPVEESAAKRRTPGMLRMLFAPEPLERAPELPPRAQRRWLRLLFAPEPLPFDPPMAPRRRARWLRRLLVPEPLDPR